jgi:hypothetical protein
VGTGLTKDHLHGRISYKSRGKWVGDNQFSEMKLLALVFALFLLAAVGKLKKIEP